MRMLLLGAGGRLGTALLPELSRIPGDLYAAVRSRAPALPSDRWLRLDVSDLHAVETAFRTLRPDIVINAAAYTNVDGAEDEPEEAERANTLAPRYLAGVAARYGAGLIHFSTDYVFDGRGTRPWSEGDPTGPLNVYGRSKLEGEQAILDSSAAAIIIRSSWLYGLDGDGFVKAILKQAVRQTDLEVVDDQIGAPTSAALLARITAAMVERLGPVREGRWRRFGGLYHLACRGEASRAAWAEEIVAAARRAGLASGVQVKPVPTSRRPMKARRPLNSRLNVEKFASAWNAVIPYWDADLREQLPRILADVSSSSSLLGDK